ncbi:winged helix-turn-helix transcriptional regulator [Streptomyces sp. NPDC057686]|uniref:winged helix-turn-helix transcriptional regulator n=1 Tax=Streptomyces sp. NPDC057686 TaxID=3346212 RepID=UPI003686C649
MTRAAAPGSGTGDQHQRDLAVRRRPVGRVRGHRAHPPRPRPKSLTQSLRALERDGFVVRTQQAPPERRVEYAPTPLGRGLLGPLDAACDWTREHWDELIDARETGLAVGPSAGVDR